MKELEENQRGTKEKVNLKVMDMIDKYVVIVFFTALVICSILITRLKRRKPILKENTAIIEKDKVK